MRISRTSSTILTTKLQHEAHLLTFPVLLSTVGLSFSFPCGFLLFDVLDYSAHDCAVQCSLFCADWHWRRNRELAGVYETLCVREAKKRRQLLAVSAASAFFFFLSASRCRRDVRERIKGVLSTQRKDGGNVATCSRPDWMWSVLVSVPSGVREQIAHPLCSAHPHTLSYWTFHTHPFVFTVWSYSWCALHPLFLLLVGVTDCICVGLSSFVRLHLQRG